MSDRELMQMALKVPLVELLESVPENARLSVDDEDGYRTTYHPVGRLCHEAAKALRVRLAQPEPDPVAWMYVNKDGECEQIEYGEPLDDPSVTLLYAAPPKRSWVGLTEEEFFDLLHFDGKLDQVEVPLIADFIRAIQKKLKEKNT